MTTIEKPRALALADTLDEIRTWVLTHPDVPVVNVSNVIAGRPSVSVVCASNADLEATVKALPDVWELIGTDPEWWSPPRLCTYRTVRAGITFLVRTYDWMEVRRG